MESSLALLFGIEGQVRLADRAGAAPCGRRRHHRRHLPARACRPPLSLQAAGRGQRRRSGAGEALSSLRVCRGPRPFRRGAQSVDAGARVRRRAERCGGASGACHRHRSVVARAASRPRAVARPAPGGDRRPFADLGRVEGGAPRARGAGGSAHQGAGRGEAAFRDRAARLAHLGVQPGQGSALHLGAQSPGRAQARRVDRQDRRRHLAR